MNFSCYSQRKLISETGLERKVRRLDEAETLLLWLGRR